MKTFRTYKNNLKQNIMYRLILLFSVLFALNADAKINKNHDYLNSEFISLNSEKRQMENILFAKVKDSNNVNVEVSDVKVIELEEEIELGFDTTYYLPQDFNALEGMYDLDWNSINLIEVEEEVELGFDTTKYLPQNFSALKGKDDVDWNTVKLIEIEEEVGIDFDTNTYLPNNFNPFEGMLTGDTDVCLN